MATPIGNLGDISLRALETLKSAEVIFCEDTRESGKLLSHYEIKKPTVSLHQHSTPERINDLLKKYAGQALVYISDAGTPGISDPGGKLVEAAVKAGFTVCPIPGASAVIAALSISGFPTDKFLFLGFMPLKGKNKTFNLIKNSEITVAFYESTHRIVKTLEQMKEILEPEREVVVARELTKKFETIYRGALEKILAELKDMSKGEFVVIVRALK